MKAIFFLLATLIAKDDLELSENEHKYINNIKNSNKGE
jgi:hypothetical protein